MICPHSVSAFCFSARTSKIISLFNTSQNNLWRRRKPEGFAALVGGTGAYPCVGKSDSRVCAWKLSTYSKLPTGHAYAERQRLRVGNPDRHNLQICSEVAQRLKHSPVKRKNAGSNPALGAIKDGLFPMNFINQNGGLDACVSR